MNPNFERYIAENRSIAQARSVNWDLRLDSDGRISKDEAWNLTLMAGDSPPPAYCLRDLGTDSRTVDVLNGTAAMGPERIFKRQPLSAHWQDLIKASVIDQLFVRRNGTNHVLNNVVRPLRVIGTVALSGEPWKLTADDVAFAFDAAKAVQHSGKLADLVYGIIISLLDPNHLTDNSPLSQTLTRTKRVDQRASKMVKSVSNLRSDLDARKSATKLPDQRAFWELVRIVFTETPRSFLDVLRFAQVKTMLITGLRVGEVALFPADWKRYKNFYDRNGQAAGKFGGYSRSLKLRYFAEKQRNKNESNMLLFEDFQPVPPMFEEILTEALDEVVRLTAPLRNTLQSQIQTGRMLPQLGASGLVRAVEVYTFLTGNPFFADMSKSFRIHYKMEYEKTRAPVLFEEIQSLQLQALDQGWVKKIGTGGLNFAAYQYFRRLKGVQFRRHDGTEWHGPKSWNLVYVNIAELEQSLAGLCTKLSDVTPLKLAVGELAPWELMFLMPKRALAEGRDGGLCDITRHCAIGRMDSSMIIQCLGSRPQNLFAVYGQTDEDRSLKLNSHSLRHLQNTELFRLGVADTTITKRFNRRSVAQSYDYDHRSLAEELERIDLPPETEERLGEKSSTVLKMIIAGKANGPIVDEFKRIQRERGEDAALDYLSVEADGFHKTLYGVCINSFTVDPCPKHLECFSGCRHLSATGLPEDRRNLVQLEHSFEVALRAVQARSSNSVGHKNQLEHGTTRLAAVRKILATPAGMQVFPDGPDLSQPKHLGGILDGIS